MSRLRGRCDLEYRIVRSDGTVRRVRDRAHLSRDTAGRPLRLDGFVIDITAEREAEARLHRVTNLYAALSECNQAIVRVADRTELLREICRVAVEYGGLRMAWIGDLRDGRVVPAASFGARLDYIEGVHISLDPGSAAGRGPTARAAREGRHVVCDDIESDPAMLPWREQALGCGFRASAAFPLRCSGELVGVLNLYAPVARFFDAELVDLLDKMAADISFALDRFARRDGARDGRAALPHTGGTGCRCHFRYRRGWAHCRCQRLRLRLPRLYPRSTDRDEHHRPRPGGRAPGR